jgi:hypothetical protein
MRLLPCLSQFTRAGLCATNAVRSSPSTFSTTPTEPRVVRTSVRLVPFLRNVTTKSVVSVASHSTSRSLGSDHLGHNRPFRAVKVNSADPPSAEVQAGSAWWSKYTLLFALVLGTLLVALVFIAWCGSKWTQGSKWSLRKDKCFRWCRGLCGRDGGGGELAEPLAPDSAEEVGSE